MNLLQRIARQSSSARSTFGGVDFSQFTFGGIGYGGTGLTQTLTGSQVSLLGSGFTSYVNAVKACPPAFGAQLVRSLILSQARFTFRNNRASQTPGRLFGTQALGILERPWTNGTTGELLTVMEWHEGLAGNAYIVNRGGSLRVLNPSWMTVIVGSEQDPTDAMNQIDGEVAGYVYKPGGQSSTAKPRILLSEEVAHWKPLPDPINPFVGMSWITPAVREIQGDGAATEHKLKFFENGATPNLVVKGIPATNDDAFRRYVALMEDGHKGLANAYKTLYLVAGADATVVGSDLQQIDFKSTQGGGETRISVLSRVPAPILGISEGLAGSALNAGNFGQARRNMADGWLYPTLGSGASCLGTIVDVPADAELWFDTSDMPFVREDGKDLAEIQSAQAAAIRTLIESGWDPASARDAVIANDMSKLKHTGLVSVQLQKPGTDPAGGGTGG